MENSNRISIEELEQAMSKLQKATDNLKCSNEQLLDFRKIMFSRFGMSEDERFIETKFETLQDNISRGIVECEWYYDFLNRSITQFKDYLKNKDKYDEMTEKFR